MFKFFLFKKKRKRGRPKKKISVWQKIKPKIPPVIFWLAIILLFLGLALCFTWPLVNHFSSSIVSQANFTDGPFFIWNLWWVKKALLEFKDPLWTNFVYFPQTVNLSLHTLTITSGLIFLPLSLFFTPLVALNLIQIGSIAASAVGMILLVNYLAKPQNYLEKAASSIAGLIFAFSPFVFSHMMAGHYNLTMTWPLPYLILFLYKTLREQKFSNGVWLGIFAVLLGYLDLQLLFFGGLITILVFLVELSSNFSFFKNWRRWVYFAIALGIFILAFLWPYGSVMLKGWGIRVPFGTFGSADVKILFGLNPLNPLFHYPNLTKEMSLMGAYRENNVPLGLGAMFVAALGIVLFVKNYWREKITFFVVFIVGVLISLGPTLQKNGQVFTNIRLPYYYLQRLPFFDIGLVSSRFALVAYFSLAVLAGLTLVSLTRFLVERKFSLLAVDVIIICMLFVGAEYYCGPLLLDQLPKEPILQKIAADPAEGSVLPYFTTSRDLFWATEYQKPMVTGALGRRIHDYYMATYKNVYPIDHFFRDEGDLLKMSDDRGQVLADFQKYKIGYVVADKLQGDPKKIADMGQWMTKLNFPLFYEDRAIVVYKIVP